MTPYDAWRTNVDETNEEAWNDAVAMVADRYQNRRADIDDLVSQVANADDALRWLCGAVAIPDHHLHQFRDLVKLAQNLRNQVEKQMKEDRRYPDAD